MKKPFNTFVIVFCILTTICYLETATGQEYKKVKKEFTITSDRVLEAVVRGDFGRFFINKSDSDDAGNVLVKYNPELFNFDYYYDREYSELFVTFEKEHIFERISDEDLYNKASEVRVNLPRKKHTNLDVSIKTGEINLDLGGIPLENFKIDSWASETKIDFNEPNLVGMNYLKVDVNMGEVKIYNLGNANFRHAFIDGGIGSMKVDLNGSYSKGEHFVEIDMDIGEIVIILPDNIDYRIKVSKMPLVSHMKVDRKLHKKGKYYYTNNYENADTKLTIRVEMGIGACVIK